jgi:hypothetical protein
VRLSSWLAIAVLCLALVGCGSVPRPFSPSSKSGGLPPPGPASALIVHPLSGTEGTPLEALTARVIASLRENDVAAIPYEIANRYRMAAQADVVAIEGDQAVLQMVVQFALPDGSAIAEDSWERVVSWSSYLAAEPQLLQVLGTEISDRMLAAMGLGNLSADGLKPGGPDLLIAPILSAPGDGAEALVGSMIAELDRLGLQTQRIRARADRPVLEARVTVRPLDTSNDLVRIVWVLNDRNGRERGRLEQQNSVPTGRLLRRWGVVAQLAASAAAPGVLDLLRRLQGGG